tara:strand:+ start:6134 stop:7468 length:1335 start_codon:yes stop_codon:yes gene_type:complete
VICPEEMVIAQAIDGNLELIEARGVTVEWFANPEHQKLYETVLQLSKTQPTLSCNTLIFELQRLGIIGEAGGVAKVIQIADSALPASATVYWVDALEEQKLSRECLAHSEELKTISQQADGRLSDFVLQVQNFWNGISPARLTQEVDIKYGVQEAIEKLEAMVRSKPGELQGIPTGLEILDETLLGLDKSDLMVIGARPSVGKTSLALQMAINMVVEGGRPGTFFSLEMPMDQLILRMASTMSKVNLRTVQDKTASQKDLALIGECLSKIATSKLSIIDRSRMCVNQIMHIARRHKSQRQTEVIFVDYLQLISANQRGNVKVENRSQVVGEISRGLKEMALELKTPVVTLAQLNRETEKANGEVKPSLANLRESGSIEQDADQVLLLYRNNSEQKEILDPETIRVNIRVAKNRNGRVNDDLEFLFKQDTTRFEQVYYNLKDGVD